MNNSFITETEVQFVKMCASLACGTSIEYIESTSRKRQAVIGRQLIFKQKRKKYPKRKVSLQDIADIFVKDHATVNHSFEVVENITLKEYSGTCEKSTQSAR